MNIQKIISTIVALLAIAVAGSAMANDGAIRLKDLSRLKSERPNLLAGYGIVTGLAGTGDNPNSKLTNQSVSNILENMGISISPDQLRSRNVAAVMITAALPSYAQSGDLLDVNVASLGDARSLVGGTLLMTSLKGPDGKVYALAQGALSVGGFKYDLNGNVVQKNHPTAGNIPGGATVEKSISDQSIHGDVVEYVLYEPDLTTVNRIVTTINATYAQQLATAVDPSRYVIHIPDSARGNRLDFLARMESLSVEPDNRAKVVINERTGTVVSGGDVRISKTTITQGDLTVSITTDYYVSQPQAYFGSINSPGVRTEVVPETRIQAEEKNGVTLTLPKDSSVADLVSALSKVKATSRDVITILQGLKTAGALHAELIIQ
jgi:flagellar P-ring protein precursor FlgI